MSSSSVQHCYVDEYAFGVHGSIWTTPMGSWYIPGNAVRTMRTGPLEFDLKHHSLEIDVANEFKQKPISQGDPFILLHAQSGMYLMPGYSGEALTLTPDKHFAVEMQFDDATKPHDGYDTSDGVRFNYRVRLKTVMPSSRSAQHNLAIKAGTGTCVWEKNNDMSEKSYDPAPVSADTTCSNVSPDQHPWVYPYACVGLYDSTDNTMASLTENSTVTFTPLDDLSKITSGCASGNYTHALGLSFKIIPV